MSDSSPKWLRAVALDLETTSNDPAVAEIVEVGLVAAWIAPRKGARLALGPQQPSTYTARFRPSGPIPPEASAVHKITDADVAHRPRILDAYEDLLHFLRDTDVLVTYNGEDFDIPILLRELAGVQLPDVPHHVDVFGLHRAARETPLRWGDILDVCGEGTPANLSIAAFSGSLTGATAFWTGESLEGAHGALADSGATMRVLGSMLRSYPDIAAASIAETAAASTAPPPGWADRARKIRLAPDGTLTLAFGKHQGLTLDSAPRGYLEWLLRSDFKADTKAVVHTHLGGCRG